MFKAQCNEVKKPKTFTRSVDLFFANLAEGETFKGSRRPIFSNSLEELAPQAFSLSKISKRICPVCPEEALL